MRGLTEFRRFGPTVEPSLSFGDCMGSRADPATTDEVDRVDELRGSRFATLYDVCIHKGPLIILQGFALNQDL